MDIHPSALIHADARLSPNIKIGPHVVIEADVEVGEGSLIEAGAILYSGSRIGKHCKIGPYAVVGGTPMDSHYQGESSYAVLEDKVELREFVTVHKGTGEGAETRIGEGSMIMTYTHITHNCKIGKGVTLVTSVQLGGYCEVGDYAFVGSTTIMHQFCRIGAYAVTGGGTASNQDILPFSMVYGMPAKHLRLNKVGLERRGFSGERYRHLEKAIRAFRRRDWDLLEQLANESDDVKQMLEFKQSSQRGICGFI